MQRRSLLKLFGTSVLAIAGSATPALRALAQRGLDEPVDVKLKSAYAALRKLTLEHPDDPRGWLRQGHVHC